MIDLRRTKDEMLAEIDTDDTSASASIAVRHRTPADLLPILTKHFQAWFSAVPADRLAADLSYLVKKGLGNAYKWGNACYSAKTLFVSAVMTLGGAVIAISDEGSGFDVSDVVERFLRREHYYAHHGSGLLHFHESPSVVSYADGGRTLLIRFLCEAEPNASDSERAGMEAKPPSQPLDIEQLQHGDRVKVKGTLAPDGRFRAAKVSRRQPEDMSCVESAIQDVTEGGQVVRVLNASLTIPECVDVRGADGGRLSIEALRQGQVAELLGSYSPVDGFVPRKIQLRAPSIDRLDELQGDIDDIDRANRVLSVVGIRVQVDDRTEIKGKLPSTG